MDKLQRVYTSRIDVRETVYQPNPASPSHLTRRSGPRKLIMLSGNGVTDVGGSFKIDVATGFERYFDLPYVDPIAVDYQPVRIVFAEIPHVVASPCSVHVQSGAPPPPPVTMTTQIEMLAHDMSVEPSEWALTWTIAADEPPHRYTDGFTPYDVQQVSLVFSSRDGAGQAVANVRFAWQLVGEPRFLSKTSPFRTAAPVEKM
jgi:hypothetical protein